jgi:hypothetical protein
LFLAKNGRVARDRIAFVCRNSRLFQLVRKHPLIVSVLAFLSRKLWKALVRWIIEHWNR